MATVTVIGRVDYVHRSGDGFKILEERTAKDGQRYTQKWTVWPKNPVQVQVGDTVQVSGFIRAAVGDPWQGRDGQERRSVELTVAQASVRRPVDASQRPQEPAGRDETSPEGSWRSRVVSGAQTGGYGAGGDDVPF